MDWVQRHEPVHLLLKSFLRHGNTRVTLPYLICLLQTRKLEVQSEDDLSRVSATIETFAAQLRRLLPKLENTGRERISRLCLLFRNMLSFDSGPHKVYDICFSDTGEAQLQIRGEGEIFHFMNVSLEMLKNPNWSDLPEEDAS